MAEKQIISVPAVAAASDIESIFVNDGTDIKQATPAQLLDAKPVDSASGSGTAWGSTVTFACKKWGPLVQVSVSGTITGNITSAAASISNAIPAGYRPPADIRISAEGARTSGNWTTSAYHPLTFLISANGAVTIYPGSAAVGDGYINVRFFYFAA